MDVVVVGSGTGWQWPAVGMRVASSVLDCWLSPSAPPGLLQFKLKHTLQGNKFGAELQYKKWEFKYDVASRVSVWHERRPGDADADDGRMHGAVSAPSP